MGRSDKDNQLDNKALGQPIRLIIYHRIYTNLEATWYVSSPGIIYRHRIFAIPMSNPLTFTLLLDTRNTYECLNVSMGIWKCWQVLWNVRWMIFRISDLQNTRLIRSTRHSRYNTKKNLISFIFIFVIISFRICYQDFQNISFL